MKVELVGFSQGVSLANREETLNYLEFRVDDGKTFRVPVPMASLEALMKEIYGDAPVPEEDAAVSPAERAEPIPDGADIFGEDPETASGFPPDDFPTSEAEVPSL